MKKSFRELLGLPIRDQLNRGMLGQVGGFVINPANGEIVALLARRDGRLILPTTDIAKVSSDTIWVDDPEALATPDEIIRIADIIKLNVPITQNKVFTVSRNYLGEVMIFSSTREVGFSARSRSLKKFSVFALKKN